MAKVILTGASNQIGRFVLPQLQQAGHAVTAISRQPPDNTDGWLQADLRQPTPGLAAEIVIHAAPLWLLPQWLAGVEGARRLIAFSSTSRLSKIDSDDEYERGIAAQLATAEQQAIEVCERHGIAWTIFRPTLIYGGGLDKNIRFIAGFIRRFGFFPLYGAGSGLRQPVHAEDLARACLRALDQPATHSQFYSLSGGETLSYRDLVARICDALDKPRRIISIPPPLFRLALLLAGRLPQFRPVSLSMLQRMNHDLCFDHAAAGRDFGYAPRRFQPEFSR
jgi:nucleoside-diphosphate-sugar epimerase